MDEAGLMVGESSGDIDAHRRRQPGDHHSATRNLRVPSHTTLPGNHAHEHRENLGAGCFEVSPGRTRYQHRFRLTRPKKWLGDFGRACGSKGSAIAALRSPRFLPSLRDPQ